MSEKQAEKASFRAGVVAAILSFGMALAAAAILIFAWLADEVFEGDSIAFDNAVRAFVHGFATEWLTAVMQFFSFVGSPLVVMSATVLLTVTFLVKKQRRSAVVLDVVMIGAIALNYILKTYFVRARPIPYFDTPLPSSFSFPSGHALFSACFCGIVAWILLKENANRTVKVIGWTAACLIALFVGLSRIYLGVHYPTDVIAGYLASIVWVAAVVTADTVVERQKGAVDLEV
ncbi:hypothetical protein BH10ACI3_BH10ACI3_01520 [soil metagenome]